MNSRSTRAYNDPLIPLLRLEGLAIGLAAIGFYALTDQSWLLFAALILAPDLAMVGYLFGNRIGAICYNCTHTYIVPVMLVFLTWLTSGSLQFDIALIWGAHIGLDRAIGYGLKRKTGFKATHLLAESVA